MVNGFTIAISRLLCQLLSPSFSDEDFLHITIINWYNVFCPRTDCFGVANQTAAPRIWGGQVKNQINNWKLPSLSNWKLPALTTESCLHWQTESRAPPLPRRFNFFSIIKPIVPQFEDRVPSFGSQFRKLLDPFLSTTHVLHHLVEYNINIGCTLNKILNFVFNKGFYSPLLHYLIWLVWNVKVLDLGVSRVCWKHRNVHQFPDTWLIPIVNQLSSHLCVGPTHDALQSLTS